MTTGAEGKPLSLPGRFVPDGEYDAALARTATGVLAEANRLGILHAAHVQAARGLARLAQESNESVELATALAVRAVTQGSVGVDLTTVADSVDPTGELSWPQIDQWQAAVAGSPLSSQGALRSEYGLLYLERYHRLEIAVCAHIADRLQVPAPQIDLASVEASLSRIFPTPEQGGAQGSVSAGAPDYSEQHAAARAAIENWTTVITGGPGTGKTTTVAGLLATLYAEARHRGERLSVAVTAPTGKAAARLQESVLAELADASRFNDDDRQALAGMQALTLHRLLGWVPNNSTRFRHHRGNRLGHDVVIVDESSMVDLLMMARLLEAIRPDTRLVLVGDPHQLTSVGAGAVLADLVRGFTEMAEAANNSVPTPVRALSTNHRYGAQIGTLAEALRIGDADKVLDTLLTAEGPSIEFLEVDSPEVAAEALRADLLGVARTLRTAALAGEEAASLNALDEHRLICAHRDGPHGVAWWNRRVESWLAEADGVDYWPHWYPGRPLLVTANDYGLGVYNGESGVVVQNPDGALRGVIAGSRGAINFSTSRLASIETMHALTVHKSQGSQARRVTVLLPPEDSRLLTRELFYTAVTRAQESVRIVGSKAEVRAAVLRRAERATGLAERLADRIGKVESGKS